jgi:hypothetical protein
MNQKPVRLKLIQDLGLAFVALSLLLSPLSVFAQGKKYVKITFETNEYKSKKKRTKMVHSKRGPQRTVASLKESPRHGNIVPVHDYVADLEELDVPRKAIVPKSKKPLAEDAEITRDMIIAK